MASIEVEVSQAVCCWCGAALRRYDGSPWWCPTRACAVRQAEWGVMVEETHGRKAVARHLYLPTPKQAAYHETRLTEALLGYPLTKADPMRPRMNRLFGGAAGGGKSKSLRYDMYRKAKTIPRFTGAILRRTLPELKKTHLREFQRDASLIGAEFIKSENQLVFENGAVIECGHCEDDDAVQKWLSAEYDQIGFDEGSTFEPDQYLEISARARTSSAVVQAAGGPWCDVVTNPGGRCWALLKDLFVTHTPDFDVYPALEEAYDPRFFVYIKALLDDNPYIDPGYARSLAMLNDTRFRQLRYGDEHITSGAFFSEWRETRDGHPWHVRDVDTTGAGWFASMDWGYNAPGVVLWWAVLPDGYYHIAAEYKFQQATADEVATAMRQHTRDLGITTLMYVACDPAMKGKTGAGKGESIFETLQRRGLPMRASDNDRVSGWARVHQFLRESPQGRPWLTVSPDCRYGTRTMPAQVQDKHNPDDLDTNRDDHWADALRYGAMSRPPQYQAERTAGPPPFLSLAYMRQLEALRRPRGVLS